MQTTTHCYTTHFSIILIVAGLATLLALPTEQAQAQTPVTKIENSAGDSVFTVFDDGSLLGLGDENTGVIPVEGAGTRMMWYPAEAAFRAGEVGVFSGNDDVWDADSVGSHSVAFGIDTYASDYASVAMGIRTTAKANGSMAMGRETIASGFASTAMGDGATASGSQSMALGDHTIAATDVSLSIGQYNSANSSDDGTLFVVGNGTNSTTPSDAFLVNDDGALLGLGEYNTGGIPAEGPGTRMMWYPAKAAFRAGIVGAVSSGEEWDDANIGNFSVALGRDTEASGSRSTAMGDGTTANDFRSTAMGGNTTASGFASTAMGNGTIASGFESTAMGDNTIAATTASLSAGEYNSANSSDDGTLFVVGNGSSSSRSDALVLDDSGNMTISGSLTQHSDRRLKNDITPLKSGVLGELSKITPSQFQFKNQKTHPSGLQVGLIAQEVQQQFPGLVNKGTNGYLSVSYSKFTAVLLKGMQEQQQEIQTLKDENKNIKKRLAKLEQQNSRAAGLPWQTTMLLFSLLLAGGMAWKIAENNDF